MATADEIVLLREYASGPLLATPREDIDLSTIIDEEGSVSAAAARLWRLHAASLSDLVDVTESGSSRKMGSLYKNALDIAGSFTTVTEEASKRPRSRAIVRGDAP